MNVRTTWRSSSPLSVISVAPVAVLAACTLMPALGLHAQDAANDVLVPEAMQLEIHHGRKKSTGAKVQKKLTRAVREALNAWAGVARELDLTVVVCKESDAIVLGHAPDDVLIQAAGWSDDASEMFDGIVRDEGANGAPAVVMFLFDRAGFASDGWPRFLDTLVDRKLIQESFARRQETSPGSFTVRNAPIFVQATYDQVGNAAAGDDEFRLCNEIAHKTAQTLAELRFGRLPEVIRWGLGHVVEQRLYQSIYQFNATGFVAAKDHFDWPKRVQEMLHKDRKRKSFSLAGRIMGTQQPGAISPGQMYTWAFLEYLLAKDPEQLIAMLSELSQLHAEADPAGRKLDYQGDGKGARDVVARYLEPVSTKTLDKHIKRVK